MPSRDAVLLLDLQVDFMDAAVGKMPVSDRGADRVLSAANDILAGRVLQGALPVLVVNRFPAGARLANWFRRGAAVDGSAGAQLDPRLRVPAGMRVFPKQAASAFTNPDLEPYLRQHDVGKVWVIGVFAEGCVRATAHAARRLGFDVVVPEAEIATNAGWKAAFARWSLRRGDIAVVPTVRTAARAS
jgi:nicotinamidase-related amidase